MSCNLPGRVGTCSPYQAGSNPEKECSEATPPCQSSCDGLGNVPSPPPPADSAASATGTVPAPRTTIIPTAVAAVAPAAGGSGGGSGSGGASSAGSGGSGSGGNSWESAGGITGSVDAGDFDGSAGMGGRGGNGGSGSVDAGSGGAAGTGGSAGIGGVDGGSSLPTGGTIGSIFDGGIFSPDGGGVLPDGGGVSSPSDSGLDGGGVDSRIGLGRANGSCSCDLGNTSSSHAGTGSMLLLGGLTWLARRAGKRRRRGASAFRSPCREREAGRRIEMNPRLGALALALLLPTCAAHDGSDSPATSVETARSALGTNPPSEIATWTRVAGTNSPDPRVGQSAAYDSSRKLVMVFGGAAALSGDKQSLRQDVWEWNPATGVWRDRTPAGVKPDARSEAAVVYDSVRDRFILFGGRAGGGSNFEDTWEWNPTDGTWTDKTGAGQTPDARARHAMVYDVKRKVVVLFGGGRSIQGTTAAASTDVAAITTAFASTWEYEPVSAAWTDRTPASAAASPSARYDVGMVWDGNRNLVVLFGGMQKPDTSASGSFKQDTWEWNGEAGTWTERTASGTKPSARFGHGMAYDPGRSKVVLFGGCDDNAGATKNDLWDWEPGTGTWTERSVPTTVPSARAWASLVLVTALLTDSNPVRMELFADRPRPSAWVARAWAPIRTSVLCRPYSMR